MNTKAHRPYISGTSAVKIAEVNPSDLRVVYRDNASSNSRHSTSVAVRQNRRDYPRSVVPDRYPTIRLMDEAVLEISHDLRHGTVAGCLRDRSQGKDRRFSSLVILATGLAFVLEAVLLAL